MYTCAQCTVLACAKGSSDKLPSNCPMRDEGFFEECIPEYSTFENKEFYTKCSEIEAIGYGEWSRLKEIIVLCQQMGYKKVGMAFCFGLRREAKIIETVLRKNGITVVSVICKTGGIEKGNLGIPEEHKVHPGQFEAICNPIAQAKLLNNQQTEFNIAVGLCVGHDSLFYKYSDAMVTTLIAKDRALAHNPIGAVYCAESYFKEKLFPEE